jgi:cell wall-associated NlpC family hydrolase
MSLTAQKRFEIVRAAKEWLGTPYHHHARVKHAGADCAMFPLAVYQECGVLPKDFSAPEYSVQWHLHRSEEIYLQTLAPVMREYRPCLVRCIREDYVTCVCGDNDKKFPSPADFVVFKFGRTFSHGAIVIEWPIIIHSYIPHGVLLSDAERDGELMGRERKFFEVKAWV